MGDDITDDGLLTLARATADGLTARGGRLATAESCTGGWIAKCLTDLPGASAWFVGGWVVYSDTAKTAQLGVPQEILAAHGAVSEAVVHALAQGALARCDADHVIAVSGIAGPDGGSVDKPVGMVCFAWGGPTGIRTGTVRFTGNRDAVRRQAVAHALQGLTR